MPKYRLTVDVEEVHGHQYFEVVADSEAEGIAKHEAGESEFIEEEVEVVSLGAIEVELIEP